MSLYPLRREMFGRHAQAGTLCTPLRRCRSNLTHKLDIRTLRKGLRRALEHDWEHLLQLFRYPGGPAW